LSGGGPVPAGGLAGQSGKCYSNFGVIIYETVIEIGKAKEGLDLVDVVGAQPVLYDFDFTFIHMETIGCTYKA
jgi:hypothetical protein